jgi:hypothetical protein
MSSGHRAWGPGIAEAWSQETEPPAQAGNLMKETLLCLSFLLTEQKFEIHTDFGQFWTDFPDRSKNHTGNGQFWTGFYLAK